MSKNTVLINKTGFYSYPDSEYNFSPSERYPEYKHSEIAPRKNDIYEAVRNSFCLMGYDVDNFGLSSWNPLKKFIKPGDTVLLKPNLVLHENRKPENGTDCLITHPSIIRAVADYALIALNGTGKLVIGDAPLQDCNFDILANEQGLNKIIDFYKANNIKTDIELCDFRNYKSDSVIGGVFIGKETASDNGITVDLEKDSEFFGISEERYKNLRVTNYPHDMMQKHHNPDKNEYIVAKKMLEADVIINMPKPKTHRYAGVTIAMKNFVGINANKECLPHHSVGSLDDNGDEYKKKSYIKKLYSKVVDIRNNYMRKGYRFITMILRLLEKSLKLIIMIVKPNSGTFCGSWHGNDTIWRTIIDLNKIVHFADKNGKMQDASQRKLLIIGDMIISGENTGPLAPSPRNVGVLVVGECQVCFDEVVCAYMGYDYNKISSIKNARKIAGKYNFCCGQDSLIKSNDEKLNNKKIEDLKLDLSERFAPSPFWKDYLIEREVK